MDAELKEYLEAMEGRLNEHINRTFKGLENGREGHGNGLEGLESRLVEKMRDMQTELLRVFAAASEGQTIQLRKM